MDAFSTGSSFSDQVNQIPAQIYSKPEESAEIKCSHSIKGYNQILWYKQAENGQFQFLGYMLAGSAVPEAGLDVKFGGSANEGSTATIIISRLSLGSSAVYFCAASLHGATCR